MRNKLFLQMTSTLPYKQITDYKCLINGHKRLVTLLLTCVVSHVDEGMLWKGENIHNASLPTVSQSLLWLHQIKTPPKNWIGLKKRLIYEQMKKTMELWSTPTFL